MILDSGSRREFTSGAVRDIQQGKGRCDLLPLDVVCNLYESDHVPAHLAAFMATRKTSCLYTALYCFAYMAFENVETMLLEVAVHFEEGALKYGEHNWQKGLPVNCYIDSALRHWLKYKRGDTDERHDRAFVWNILCCIWENDYHKYEEGTT